MRFLAIDVETANADYSSICQIGVATFEDGQVVDKWVSLIDPEDYFDPFNTSIHGITEDDVKGQPVFSEVFGNLQSLISGSILVHHMPFDRTAINRVCSKHGLQHVEAKWLDSAAVARRAWEEFAYKGYGLQNLCNHFGIEFHHHDALEDAVAAGKVFQMACDAAKMTPLEWLERVGKPVFLSDTGTSSMSYEGNVNGPLFGENIVFTGSLVLPRREASELAAKLGCNVASSVSKKTTMLVVGIQDHSRFAGYDKSGKHRKAEELIGKGVPIRIVSESDFTQMVDNASGTTQ